MSFKTLFAVIFLTPILLSAALAQEKVNEKPAPTPAQDFSKEAYTIDRHFTRISVENDGTNTRETTAEVKMLAEAGVKAFAVLNFTYTSANEVVDVDYVRVRKPDGTVVKTPDYNIQDMPGEVTRTAPLYSDIHEKHVAVKGLAVGDVLEYLIRYRVMKPEVPGHFWYEYSFTKKSIMKDERLEISVPREKYVKVVSPEFKPEIAEEGARRVYRWTHANLIVPQKDPDEIPRRIPPNPDLQVTTFASWEEVGRWYGGLQKDPLTVTAAIQAKSAELTKGLKTNDEKIRAIYSFVSLKYHYIGLDFGIGRYQPHAADDVLDNGYDDCKDKHTLLASLLKAAGIDAWPVLIHGERKLDPDVPSPAQFNHVITVVPQAGGDVWLDTTPEVAPYGLILVNLRNKQSLMIPTDQPPTLTTTPENPPRPQRQEFSMAGKLSADGVFTGHAEQSYDGDTEVLLRAAFRQVPESQWRDLVQRFSYGMNFGGDVSNVKVTPPDAVDRPFEVSYDYVRKNYADWDNHHTSPALPPMGLEVMKDAKDKKPTEPVLLGALGTIIYRSRVELPEGYNVTAPPRCHLTQPFADYDAYTNVEDGVMTTTRELKIKKTEVPLSSWEDYRTFGRTLADDEFNFLSIDRKTKVVASVESGKKEAGKKKDETEDKGPKLDDSELDSMFRDGVSALQSHDYQRAQELYEKIIANDPSYKGAHFNLGVALMSQRNVTDALEQFRKEEDTAPNDSRSYQVLAGYLTQVGRRDEAIEQWRKLLKVEPENRTAASTLGRLLYQAEKYSEAAEVLQEAVKTAPDSPGLLQQLGESYVKSGEKDKAVATLRQAVEQKADDPSTLNDVAYTLADNKLNLDLAQQYAEKAVRKLDEASQNSASSHDAGLRVTAQLAATWDTLGWVYYRQGDLKRAENLIRPAWLLGEAGIVAEHLAEIYEKEGKTQLAAQTYEYALAVSSVPTMMIGAPQSDVVKSYRKHADDIIAHYQKLTGKKPSNEVRRLPNGEWTKTPAEKLRSSREVKLRNAQKLSASAQFIVTFKPGKADSAEYVNGDESLDALSDELTAAQYPLEFPHDSGAILMLRVDVSCRASTPCTARLIQPVAVPVQGPVVAQ